MSLENLRILVTGAGGFIGMNLVARLRELPDITVSTMVRDDPVHMLPHRVAEVDAVVHLAGANRPEDNSDFMRVNAGLTSELCGAIQGEFYRTGRRVTLLLASSTQATQDNPYGQSKLAAERALQALALATGNPCVIFRLPGVFGKWCRPNYNSVVATFCYNAARALPLRINNPATTLPLVYIDDVISAIIGKLRMAEPGCSSAQVEPIYNISLGELAKQILEFANSRTSLVTERVGSGLTRALYATYLTYLPSDKFAYVVEQHRDSRGVFVEMLKTKDSGQLSYFTAHPGITRGGHYHHTKSEKFLVVKGDALFRFRNIVTNELVEFRAGGAYPRVVDTIPGWSHDITNVGTEELVVMLWANENFDRARPDTVASKVAS